MRGGLTVLGPVNHGIWIIWSLPEGGISFPAIVALDMMCPVSIQPGTWRAWLLAAFLLSAVVLGGVFVPRSEREARASTTPQPSRPQVPALAPGAVLPPSTPAFSPRGPDLVGRVVSTQGDPIPGAGIFIDAARPRVGRGYT